MHCTHTFPSTITPITQLSPFTHHSDCLTTPAPHSLSHIKAAHKHSPSAKSCFPLVTFLSVLPFILLSLCLTPDCSTLELWTCACDPDLCLVLFTSLLCLWYSCYARWPFPVWFCRCLINIYYCTWIPCLWPVFTEDFANSDPAASSHLPSSTMDSISLLLHLRQGGLTMEEYVHQFCELSYQVPLYDEYLFKNLFYFGLTSQVKARFNKSLFSGGVYHGSLRGLLDYALSCAGSSFTGGVPEPAPIRELAESAPEPAPIRELAESAPEPAPIRELAESAPEPAPSRELAESAPEPAPSRELAESAPEPAPSQELAESAPEPAPIQELAESAPEPAPIQELAEPSSPSSPLVPPSSPSSPLVPPSSPMPPLIPFSSPMPPLVPFSSPMPPLVPFSSPMPRLVPSSSPMPPLVPSSSPPPPLTCQSHLTPPLTCQSHLTPPLTCQSHLTPPLTCQSHLTPPLTCQSHLTPPLTCQSHLTPPLTCQSHLTPPLTCQSHLTPPLTCQSHLTPPLTCQSHLTPPLTCQSHLTSLLSRPPCPGGLLFHWPHMDLVLRPLPRFHLRSTALLDFALCKRLEAAPRWGALLWIWFPLTQTAHHPWTTFPIMHCTHTFPSTITPITQLSPFTHHSDCLTTPAPHSLSHIKAAHKHSPSAKSCFPLVTFLSVLPFILLSLCLTPDCSTLELWTCACDPDLCLVLFTSLLCLWYSCYARWPLPVWFCRCLINIYYCTWIPCLWPVFTITMWWNYTPMIILKMIKWCPYLWRD